MLIIVVVCILLNINCIEGYSNYHTLVGMNNVNDLGVCAVFEKPTNKLKMNHLKKLGLIIPYRRHNKTTPSGSATRTYTVTRKSVKKLDPIDAYQYFVHTFLFGDNTDGDLPQHDPHYEPPTDRTHYPNGQLNHAEKIKNVSGVHMPYPEYFSRGYVRLRMTNDLMQTAINAFFIFVYGGVSDIENLPQEYVLKSARTIAMMKIPREKLAATWTVVKGDTPPGNITIDTLELYRPLFKYVPGYEIAKLNMMDKRILSYIGTHPDLNRHQIGIAASAYITHNPGWFDPRNLNVMNNLLCGVPISKMRKLPPPIYLQLSSQVFYHIHACDTVQRRFYLSMMTKTQTLGKSYSWNARDVTRLGLLLPQVNPHDFGAINPPAMAGITPKIMMDIPIENLRHLTALQTLYLSQKTLNILTRRLKEYEDRMQRYNSGVPLRSAPILIILSIYCNKKYRRNKCLY